MSVFIGTYLPLLSLLLGIGGTLSVEALRQRGTRRRDEATSQNARELAVLDRREVFEIESLKAAYDALGRLTRAATRQHFLDRAAAKVSDSLYGSHRVANVPGALEVDEELRLANGETAWTVAMILDDDLREKGKTAHAAFSALPWEQKTVEQADIDWNKAGLAMNDAQKAIARRVRGIFTAGLVNSSSITSVSQGRK